MFDFNIYSFEQRALETFRFQYDNNALYRRYVQLLNRQPKDILKIADIPFLPISFFKTHEIKTTDFDPLAIFESSGTTKTGNSRHFVKDPDIYRQSFTKAFNIFYGSPHKWCILALLPSYLERNNSSLVVMANELIRLSGHPSGGFFLDQYDRLYEILMRLIKNGQQTLLLGVTFALLDFFENRKMDLQNTVVMETGGMKGRKEEMTREEVHSLIIRSSGVTAVHSEFGMTELLSQAYSYGEGIFKCPPWMKIVLRSEDDPFGFYDGNDGPIKEGLINVIDLANRFSCSFIATDDVGKLHDSDSFEVLGRVDNSDIRGCSLLVV